MSRVLLIYPFFRRAFDRSRFRFPPLGIAYLSAALRDAGHDVALLDCTFLSRREALDRARGAGAEVVGISCLATMLDECRWLAGELRAGTALLVAGGPLPTCEPGAFLPPFDAVVRGEGEATIVELVAAHEAGRSLAAVPGVVTRPVPLSDGDGGDGRLGGDGGLVVAPPRPFAARLDALAFPARDLLPNAGYIRHGRRRYGFAVTTVMSTRGCPFACEFCSNVVFGCSYRERSPGNVVDEVEEALRLGYERISFADDVFTLRPERVRAVCEEIRRRGLRFSWECLGRVDSLDEPTAREMKAAGCSTVFFGIESGNDEVLRLMNKRITTAQAREAVLSAKRAGLEVGAFFILFYPGETDDTVVDTLRFARSLPLDYVGLTMPYPLPGTRLSERIGPRLTRPWRQSDGLLPDHVLTFDGDFSQGKMRFAIAAGQLQFRMAHRLGGHGRRALGMLEGPSEKVLRLLK